MKYIYVIFDNGDEYLQRNASIFGIYADKDIAIEAMRRYFQQSKESGTIYREGGKELEERVYNKKTKHFDYCQTLLTTRLMYQEEENGTNRSGATRTDF